MGTLAVQGIVDKLRLDLVDEAATTWTDDDLLECLNEAVRALCVVKSDAYVLTEYVGLAEGTVQSLPQDGIALIDIFENQASKRRVTQVDLELLDETSRFWPAGATTTDVKHFAADPRDKTQFRVYPPNDGYGSVYATFGANPDPMAFSDALSVGDHYEPPLVQYALGAAYRRNTQRQDLGKTQGYTQAFLTMLGLSAQTQIALAPRVSQSPGS
jgi:hypothetical protein